MGEETRADEEEEASAAEGNGTAHFRSLAAKGDREIVTWSNIRNSASAANQIFVLCAFIASGCLGLADAIFTRYVLIRLEP